MTAIQARFEGKGWLQGARALARCALAALLCGAAPGAWAAELRLGLLLLGDDASFTFDAVRGTYPTSRPMGDNRDGKLYPFKYKTADQPKTIADDRLIALDTFEYMKGSGNVDTAVEKGLVNMGYPAAEPYEWVKTDTLQLLNHGVNPASGALQCSSCHENTTRMDLAGELGYGVKAAQQTVCTQCHGSKERKPFRTLHDKHVKDKKYDCSWCHAFSRPERVLRMP